jgi:hypothetical protein
MANHAPDYVNLTRICEFTRRLHQLHRLGGEDAIDHEFSAVCRAIWGSGRARAAISPARSMVFRHACKMSFPPSPSKRGLLNGRSRCQAGDGFARRKGAPGKPAGAFFERGRHRHEPVEGRRLPAGTYIQPASDGAGCSQKGILRVPVWSDVMPCKDTNRRKSARLSRHPDPRRAFGGDCDRCEI